MPEHKLFWWSSDSNSLIIYEVVYEADPVNHCVSDCTLVTVKLWNCLSSTDICQIITVVWQHVNKHSWSPGHVITAHFVTQAFLAISALALSFFNRFFFFFSVLRSFSWVFF